MKKTIIEKINEISQLVLDLNRTISKNLTILAYLLVESKIQSNQSIFKFHCHFETKFTKFTVLIANDKRNLPFFFVFDDVRKVYYE